MPSIGAGNLSVEGHLFPLKHFDNMHLMLFYANIKPHVIRHYINSIIVSTCS